MAKVATNASEMVKRNEDSTAERRLGACDCWESGYGAGRRRKVGRECRQQGAGCSGAVEESIR